MYEYIVIKSSVNAAEEVMNEYAEEGWRVIEVSPNVALGMGIIITFEREKNK